MCVCVCVGCRRKGEARPYFFAFFDLVIDQAIGSPLATAKRHYFLNASSKDVCASLTCYSKIRQPNVLSGMGQMADTGYYHSNNDASK